MAQPTSHHIHLHQVFQSYYQNTILSTSSPSSMYVSSFPSCQSSRAKLLSQLMDRLASGKPDATQALFMSSSCRSIPLSSSQVYSLVDYSTSGTAERSSSPAAPSSSRPLFSSRTANLTGSSCYAKAWPLVYVSMVSSVLPDH